MSLSFPPASYATITAKLDAASVNMDELDMGPSTENSTDAKTTNPWNGSSVGEVLVPPTSAKPIAEFKAGNEKALNSLQGPAMKASKGKTNLVAADELVLKLTQVL